MLIHIGAVTAGEQQSNGTLIIANKQPWDGAE